MLWWLWAWIIDVHITFWSSEVGIWEGMPVTNHWSRGCRFWRQQVNHHYSGMFWIFNWHWWTTLLVVKLRTLCLFLGTCVVSPAVGASSSSRLVYSHFGSKGGKHNSMKNVKFWPFKFRNCIGRRPGDGKHWLVQIYYVPPPTGQHWIGCHSKDVHIRNARMLLWMILPKTLQRCFTESAHTRPQNCHGRPWNCERPCRRRNKSPDEHGLLAELLKYSTTDCHTVLLAAFNAILETGVVPETWQKIIFTVLPKFKRALQRAVPACCFFAAALQDICFCTT